MINLDRRFVMEVARTTATGLLLIRLGSSAPSLPGLWPPTLIKGDAIGGASQRIKIESTRLIIPIDRSCRQTKTWILNSLTIRF